MKITNYNKIMEEVIVETEIGTVRLSYKNVKDILRYIEAVRDMSRASKRLIDISEKVTGDDYEKSKLLAEEIVRDMKEKERV
jgi:hypothetical protein